MSAKKKSGGSWLVLLLLVASVLLWLNDLRNGGEGIGDRKKTPTAEAPARTDRETPAAIPPPSHVGAYEVHRECRIVPRKSNDGDSFLVALPDGREAIFRLYYVDAPESAFRRYQGGETNYQRIRQQAADLGGITPEQAVKIGERAKHFTLGLLERTPFTLYTAWDSPFGDDRYHAFVEVSRDGKPRWLHELLVDEGLARLKTKPADLPDGTPASEHLSQLRLRQQEAKTKHRGVWEF